VRPGARGDAGGLLCPRCGDLEPRDPDRRRDNRLNTGGGGAPPPPRRGERENHDQDTQAILYTRVSTGDQAENGTSLAVQLSACLKKAEQMGAQVVRHHEDAGVSGARFDTRPGVQAALEDIETGRADALIVYNISRLSRDREHQSAIKRRVQKAGACLVFCDMAVEGHARGQPAAEHHRRLRRVRAAGVPQAHDDGAAPPRRGRLQPCRSPYMWPFGYQIPTRQDVLLGKATLEHVGRYSIVEEEADRVRGIFARYAGGDSLRAIARWLTDGGVPTPRDGAFWRPSTLKRILENPVYKGSATFGRRRNEADESLIRQGYKLPFRVRETPRRIGSACRPPRSWTGTPGTPATSG
jgi:site-specific DNA recombinase